MDDAVGPVASFAQEAAESVFHRAGDGRENVGLHRRELDDIFADEHFGDAYAVGKNVLQDAKSPLGFVGDPLDLRLIQMHRLQPMLLVHRDQVIANHADFIVDDHRPVMRRDQRGRVAPVGTQRRNDSIVLPRSRRAGGVIVLPGYIDFEEGIMSLRAKFLIIGHAH